MFSGLSDSGSARGMQEPRKSVTFKKDMFMHHGLLQKAAAISSSKTLPKDDRIQSER